MKRKCRYRDCPTLNPIAGTNEQVTCNRCRKALGLEMMTELGHTRTPRATGDFIDVLHFFRRIGDRQPGTSFQSILSTVLDQIYCNTGKWYDPDMEEIYNDEFLDALQDLLKENNHEETDD